MAAPTMYHGPAEIVRQLLIDAALGVVGSPVKPYPDWAVFYSTFPDQNVAVRGIGVFDTEPVQDGRYMETGDVIDHPGITIMTRAENDRESAYKTRQIIDYLTRQTANATVELPTYNLTGPVLTKTYTVVAFSKKSGPVPLQPVEKDRAFRHTTNWTVSLEEVVE